MDNLPLSGLPTGTTLENNATIVTVQTVGGTVVNQRVPKSLFFSQALTGALIAANNLSDIADKAIALANLGVHNLQYSAGTAAPTGTLGNIGDFAFNDNFEWYEKTAATTWILRVNGVTSAELTTATTGMLTQATADTRYAPLEGAAQSGLRYNYSSTTTFPSTSGQIRFNNAAISSVTQINIHDSDRNSASNADVLAILGIGSRIQVALESNEEVYAWFRVTGSPIDNGTDRTIPVSVISSVGTFSAGEVSIGVIGGAGGGGGAVPVGSIYYQWATSIAASDPTAGFIKSNNASVDLDTTIYVSETDVETSNRAALLSQITAGGILRMQKVADGAYVDFTVTTNTDNGAWRSIAVAYSAGSNSPLLSLAADDSVVLAWLPPVSSGGGATGLQYTYVNTAGTPAAGQIRSANISFVGLSTVSISATDAQTAAKSTADVLARLKVGAIIEIAASQANKVRGTITADYAVGTNSFEWSGQIVSGAIANNATVYLSIVSDAPSTATSGGGGGITFTESSAAILALSANAGIISNTSGSRQQLTLPSGSTTDICSVQGFGAGLWQVFGAQIYFPDGSNNTGVRNKTTHRYASASFLRTTSGEWILNDCSDINGLELFTGSVTFDPSTVTYLNALATAGATISDPQKNNIDSLITALKANSSAIWNKITGLYLFAGNLAASQAINAKTPGTSNLTFAGTSVHDATGWTTNGTTSAASTGILPPASRRGLLSLNFSAFGATNPGVIGGAISTSSLNRFYGGRSSVSIFNAIDDVTEVSQTATAASAGTLSLSRTNNSDYKTFVNGTLKDTVVSAVNTATHANQIALGAITSAVGASTSFRAATYSAVVIGENFTDAEVTQLASIQDGYRLGR